MANSAALDDDNGKNKGGGGSEFLALDMGQAPQGDQYMQMQLMDGGQVGKQSAMLETALT